jgi:mycoredoxin
MNPSRSRTTHSGRSQCTAWPVSGYTPSRWQGATPLHFSTIYSLRLPVAVEALLESHPDSSTGRSTKPRGIILPRYGGDPDTPTFGLARRATRHSCRLVSSWTTKCSTEEEDAMRLYQAEWCPFSHRVRAKLTELGVEYEAVNVSASARERPELEALTGSASIPVLVDGETVISDSDEIIAHLQDHYRVAPMDTRLHRRELSPTVYGALSLSLDEATGRLRESLSEEGVEVLDELDLSPFLGGKTAYRVLLAVDREFFQRAFAASPGAAALAMLKVSVYEEDGLTRIDAIEPEKAAQQVRDSQTNDRGLALRKLLIQVVKSLERNESTA